VKTPNGTEDKSTVGTSHNTTGNPIPSDRQSFLLQPGNPYSFYQTILFLRSGNPYSQRHTARRRYLCTTNQPISVHNSSMNITKTPIGSRAAWRQPVANSIKMRPAGTTDTVATKLSTRSRQIYLSTITDQKQQVRYYSDRRPARLYQTSVPPACSLLRGSFSRPLAARIVYRQYSSRCRHASLQPPDEASSATHSLARSQRLPAVLQPLPTSQAAASGVIPHSDGPFQGHKILNRADNGQEVVTSVSGCLKCYDIPQYFERYYRNGSSPWFRR
jgi:hypothetical protein